MHCLGDANGERAWQGRKPCSIEVVFMMWKAEKREWGRFCVQEIGSLSMRCFYEPGEMFGEC